MALSAADFLRHRNRSEAPIPAVAPAEAYTVPLPSRGLLYAAPLESVQMSPFTIGQIKSLKSIVPGTTTKADAERITVDAMARSIHGANPLDLSEGDFKFLMYWARLNSFGPYTLRLESKWPDTKDGDTVVTGEPILHTVTRTDLEPVSIDTAILIDKRFGPSTMRDKIAILDMDDDTDKWVASHAAYLRGGELRERMDRLGSMSLTDLHDIRTHMVSTYHGAREFVEITRQREGQTEAVRVELTIDITDFFP